MLQELRASVTEVARRFGVSRQSVYAWLRRHAADQGLGDRSSRPHGCPHQMSPATEARIVEISAVGAGRPMELWQQTLCRDVVPRRRIQGASGLDHLQAIAG